MCRICLKADNEFDIFVKISDPHSGRSVAEHLKQLSCKLKVSILTLIFLDMAQEPSFQVTMEPGMPSMLCPQCLDSLIECSRLRELAEKTNKYLKIASKRNKREKLNLDEGVKEELNTQQSDDSDDRRSPEMIDEPNRVIIKEEAFDSEDELPLQVKIEEKDDSKSPTKAKLKRRRAKKDKSSEESAGKESPKRLKRPRKLEVLEDVDDGKFYCCKCPVFFEDEAQTLQHYQTTHLLDTKAAMIPKINIKKRFEFECKMCLTTCKTLCKLKLHQKQFQHTKQCTECGLFVPRNKFEYRKSLERT